MRECRRSRRKAGLAQSKPVSWRMPHLGHLDLCLLILVVSALAALPWFPDVIVTPPTATTSQLSPIITPMQCPVDSETGGCCICLDEQLVFACTVVTKLQSPLLCGRTLTHRVRIEPTETKTVVVNLQPSRDVVCTGHTKYEQSVCRTPPRSLVTFVVSAEDAGSAVCIGFERQGMTTGHPFVCFLVEVTEPPVMSITAMRVRIEPTETKTVAVSIQPSRDVVCTGCRKYKQSVCRTPPTRMLAAAVKTSMCFNPSFVLSAEEDAGFTVCVAFERQGMTCVLCFRVDVTAHSATSMIATDSTSNMGESTASATKKTVGETIVDIVFVLIYAAFLLFLAYAYIEEYELNSLRLSNPEDKVKLRNGILLVCLLTLVLSSILFAAGYGYLAKSSGTGITRAKLQLCVGFIMVYGLSFLTSVSWLCLYECYVVPSNVIPGRHLQYKTCFLLYSFFYSVVFKEMMKLL